MVSPPRLLAVAACAALLGGCKQTKPDGDDPAQTPTAAPTPVTPRRVEPFAAPELGAQPGYIEGGMVYAAVRVGAVQAFGQSLPLPPDVAADLAEMGAAIGVDFRVDDLRARFGLPDDVVISMTLARPLGANLDRISSDLQHGGAFLDALSYEPPQGAAPDKVEIAFRSSESVRPPAAKNPPGDAIAKRLPGGLTPLSPPKPVPPPPSVDAIAKADEFRRRFSQLGTHLRIHIPTADPARIVHEIEMLSSRRMLTQWAGLCGAIPTATQCIGESDFVLIARPGKTGLDLDVVIFGLAQDADERGQILTARNAVLAKHIDPPHLRALRGDAAVYLDATAIRAMGRVMLLARAVRRLSWTSTEDDRRSAIERQLERIESIEKLADAKLLFAGVSAEARADEDGLAARVRWHLAPEQKERANALLHGPELVGEVPTLDALCHQAAACGRTRGLPAPGPLRDELATGIYAARRRELERVFERGGEWSAMFALAAAWPNLLGAAAHWPSQEIGGGPEALIAGNVVDALGRIEGFGGSLRGVKIAGGSVDFDFVGYARLRGSELDLARTGLSLADAPTSKRQLSGVEGRTTVAEISGSGVEVSVFLHTDPPDPADPPGSARFGWAALAGSAERFAWLLSRAREPNASPVAAFEVPDLWNLVSGVAPVASELSFAQTWLRNREFRAVLSLSNGAPVIDATLRPTPPTSPPAK